jgi:outer membrane protein, heavy metal efflux system
MSRTKAVLLLLVVPLAAWAESSSPPTLTAGDYSDEAALAELLWNQSPDVIEARTSAGVAASEVTRARTLPNPTLDFTWGTIPIGRTNPPGLDDPLSRVPNYSTGISELVEVAKRGPRQAAAVAELERARAQALATFAGRFFDLLGAIGRITKSQLRAGVTNELVDASEQLLELDRARASKGDLAVIDLDRAEVEHLHLVATRDAALTDLEQARAECAAMVARPCGQFESTKAARNFIEPAIVAPLPATWSDEAEQRRPDIAALDATLRAARQRTTLAERRVIPDVTVRVGYTYDTFLVSGNQQQSLALGVQLPLPVAERGKADLEAATVTLLHAAETRQLLVDTGRLGVEAGAHRRDLLNARLQQLETALAKAREVRDTLIAAQQRGGASLIDVLLARRAYEELLLDRIDLLGDAYDATLKVRQTVALFPHPADAAQIRTP